MIRSLDVGSPVLSLALPPGGHEVLCSTADGCVHVLSDPSFTLNERMPDIFQADASMLGGKGARPVDFTAAAAFL